MNDKPKDWTLTNESRGYHRGRYPITDGPGVDLGPPTREQARLRGFTGDVCPECQGFHMQMAGHCQVCSDCGATTGCS